MDVGAWLRGLGLSQYEPAFHDNDVDAEVLPKLTADDLLSLGITSLGHRRKLLAAIAALRSSPAPYAAPPPAAGPAPGAPPAAYPSRAERRQLTVMFADLVGSTALSARLDPEELRDVLRAYQDAAAGAIARIEGQVAKFMGDGVLAYFGFPQAHEDDAERSVRAGLDITDAVGRLRSPDGSRLASASEDNTLRMWWAPQKVADLVAEAHNRLPRQLTREQEERFYLTPTSAATDAR